jgi:hypothetical protein
MILGCIIIGLIALRRIAHDRLTTPFTTSAPRLIGIENRLIEDKDAADLGYKIVVRFFCCSNQGNNNCNFRQLCRPRYLEFGGQSSMGA